MRFGVWGDPDISWDDGIWAVMEANISTENGIGNWGTPISVGIKGFGDWGTPKLAWRRGFGNWETPASVWMMGFGHRGTQDWLLGDGGPQYQLG